MTSTFNYTPYYDDFNENKNFMRILFKPGYAVQGRELTQIQTILANQIEKFGNHIFKNGSPVVGGKISLDERANYIILDSQYSGSDIVIENFLDKTIVSYNSTKSVRAKVIAIDDSFSSTPVLIIKYLSGDVFDEDDVIQVYGQNTLAKLKSTNAVGRSYVASIQDGVYYFKGNFVKVEPQFLVVETYYRQGHNSTTNLVNPSYKIGIQFEELITDYIDDASLLDPAQGAFNYQAPGADRYTINTVLSKRTIDSADTSSFFEVIRLVDGVKTKEVEYPIYSEINKTLARRTYEESGNYTIDPFVIALEEGDSANGKFNAILDPGKAYVGGYEVKTIAPTSIEIDRARDITNVTDYDVPTNYESSIVLDSLRGTLDISSFPALDVHCVGKTNISVASTAAYNSTKIGTIRANMIKYNDASDSNLGNTHSFTVNVFDPMSIAITGTLAAGSTNTVINLPTTFSNTCGDNAYANMYFRLTDAGGSGISPIKIASSSGTGRTITLSAAYSFAPSTNTFSIDSDFKVAESIVAQNSLNITFAGNINSDSKDASTGYAYINEPTKNSLIFETPYESIANSSITDMDLYARKVYSNKLSDAAGVITINTVGTDTFAFAGTPGTLSDSIVLNNIICFVRSDSASNATSGITPNTILSLANNNFSVVSLSASSIEVRTNTPSVKADFVIKTKINNAENASSGAVRGKQMIPLTTGEDLHAKVPYVINGVNAISVANTGIVTSVTGGYVFEDIGATFFDGTTTLQSLRTPGVAVSLQVPDVYQIVRITASGTESYNVSTIMLSSDLYDVTDYYEFDNGQRKTHYDHATIKLKRGYSSPKGRIYVQYKYLKHLSAPSPQNNGLFVVDSYLKSGSNMTYSDISKFSNKEDNKLISLRGALDFRPTRGVGSTSLNGAINPDTDSSVTLDFDYYMSRIDRIALKPTGEFTVIEGKSSVAPRPSPVKDDDMLLYTLTIPAYTESVKDITVDYVNNRRYTMRDIGKFDNRIKSLEYYISLNALEKSATDIKVLDTNGLERSKYGIMTDSFVDGSAQATTSDVGYDNRCLVDGNQLMPASLMRTFKMNVYTGNTGAYKIVGTNGKRSLMLNHTSSSFAQQPYATKSIPVANALFANFKGSMKLYPEFIGDVDTTSTARVTMNSFNGIEKAFTFINDAFKYISDKNQSWADDKNSPFAKIIDEKWYETKHVDYSETILVEAGRGGKNSRPNTWGNLRTHGDEVWLKAGAELYQKQISTSTSQVDVGTFVTDLAIQPYIKPRQVTFTAQGMRPNKKYYHFFDDVAVDNFVVAPNKLGLSANVEYFQSEPALVGNTTVELTAAAVSYYTGGNSYNKVIITNSEVGTANAYVVNETGKSLSGKILLGLDSLTYKTISSVIEHKSGVGSVSGNTITLSSEASASDDYYNGNTVFIVRQTSSDEGIGEYYTVSDYVGSTRNMILNGTSSLTGNVIYSIGDNKSNKTGQVSGCFYPPKATFRSGQRTFRVTESFNNTYDTDAISFSDAVFTSSGVNLSKTTLVNTVYNVGVDAQYARTTTSARLISSTVKSEITNTWRDDPTAQTFFVDSANYPYGLFLKSADLFFSAKDSGNIPVKIQIRPTVNGVPSSDVWYPESVAVKYPSEVNTSASPSPTDSTTYTTFDFASPVYLKPGLYAIIILTDSPEYQVWVAEKGAVTTRKEYVGVNPYIGTLYKSQNAMEYSPYINEDLMFNLNRCKFDTTQAASFSLQSQGQSKSFNADKMRLLSTEMPLLTDAPVTINYSVITKPTTGTKETTYRDIVPNIVYPFGIDEYYALGYRRRTIQDQGDVTVQLTMQTLNDAISPLVSEESVYVNAWENFVDNATIESVDFNIISDGTGYANTDTVTINSATGSGAVVYLNVNASGNVTSANVISGGSNYIDDYSITLNTSTGSGAVIVLNSEFDSSGGPADARYITKPITLADGFDAGDLRLYIAANQPAGTSIKVFCKLLSGADGTQFKDRPYQELVCINPSAVASQTATSFTEFEYRPSLTDNFVNYTGTNGVVYDTFKTFAIKIVMLTSDPAVVPKVKDLRIIALPAE